MSLKVRTDEKEYSVIYFEKSFSAFGSEYFSHFACCSKIIRVI